MSTQDDLWSPFRPTRRDPWDLRKVAHLHRRAGFGASWNELQRDLRAGPEASVRYFLEPAAPSREDVSTQEGLRQGALASGDMARLKSWWLYRILYEVDPLREKMTLFWHSHFATSNLKVENLPLMLRQNELLRRHALGEFAELLGAVVGDPAMLIWLDGADSRRERANENFAREFLELFTLGPGHYTEADIRQAAQAFTGWTRVATDAFGIRPTPELRFDAAGWDDREKTFLGRRGRWNANDIVRITLEQPAAAEFLCRKLYRFFVREEGEPAAELIRPLAAALRGHRYSVRHVLGVMLRSRHFYEAAAYRQRIKTPVEYSTGLIHTLEVPRANVRMLALAAACDRQGQELFYPPNVRGWVGGRTWLNTTTMLERSNWVNDVVWGNPEFDMPPFDPLAWAARNRIPPAQIGVALADLVLSGELDSDELRLVSKAAGDGGPGRLRRALQLLFHSPKFQLA
jgi:uncharacterized protein (DUF1800 family)